MENKVLEKNLAYIAQYNKILSDRILMTDIEKSNLSLTETKKGEYNLLLNGFEMHSKDGAEQEVLNIIKNIKNDPNSLIIVYGLGLGYLPDKLAEKCNENKVVIYEPNLEILKFVLSVAQIDALYKKNVFLCSDKEHFLLYMQKMIDSNTNLCEVFLDSYNALFCNDISEIFNLAKDVLSEKVGNMNTFIKNMPLAAQCTFSNLKKIIKCPNITQLKDIYKDKTALILCAGPSLKENISLIAQNQDKYIIFALNPTLKLLSEHSIVPDFVVNIDIVNNSNQFADFDKKNSYYVTDSFTNAATIYFDFKKHFFYISANNFINDWLRRILNINAKLETLGTSSYTAFQAAICMGFKKIIFIGQDLAFKNGECYSSGAQYDCLKCVFNSEKNEYEIVVTDFESLKNACARVYKSEAQAINSSKKMLRDLNKNIRTIKDVNGNLVPTKADYYTFVKIFENAAKNINDIELINASFGANISGFKNVKLSDIINDLNPIERVDLMSYKPCYDLKKVIYEVNLALKQMDRAHECLEKFIISGNGLLKKAVQKQTIDNELIRLINTYKNAFDRLLKCFEDELTGKILSCFAYDIYELLQSDYYSDASCLIDALNQILPVFKNMLEQLDVYKESLANSKSFIFQ